jgi:ubiquinone biosynthesis protein COQ4
MGMYIYLVSGGHDFSKVNALKARWKNNTIMATLYLAYQASKAAITVFCNPSRVEALATVTDLTTNLPRLRSLMLSSASGRSILRNRAQLNSTTVNLDHLCTLPRGMFGREVSICSCIKHGQVYEFLESNSITLDSRTPTQNVSDPELAYIMNRYRQIHDLLHVLSGYKSAFSSPALNQSR